MSALLIRSAGLRGIKPLAFRGSQLEALKHGVSDGGATAPEVEQAELLSYMGTPVMHPLTLSVGSVELYIPDSIQTITRSKTIVTTAMQGRRGTIKELYAIGDYSVSVDGLLVGEDGEFPGDKLRRILQITNAEEAVKVTSDYLRIFGIFEAAIPTESFNRLAGFENVIPFKLELLEDTAVDLIEEL